MRKVFMAMPSNKAPGYDRIPLLVIKDCLPHVLPTFSLSAPHSLRPGRSQRLCRTSRMEIMRFLITTVRSHYSGTPPYDHPVYKTTSLLRPYSFKPNLKNIVSFYYFEDPVNATTSLLRPGFYGPTVVVLTGFHCTCK